MSQSLSGGRFATPTEALEGAHAVAGRYTCWGCGNAINSAPHVKPRYGRSDDFGIYHAACKPPEKDDPFRRSSRA